MKPQIVVLRKKFEEKSVELKALRDKEAELPDDETLSPEDADRFAELLSEVEALKAKLDRAVSAEAAVASKMDEASDDDDETEKSASHSSQFVGKSRTVPAQAKKHFNRKTGDGIARFASGILRAHKSGVDSATKVIIESSGDHEMADMVSKALSSTGSSTGATTVPKPMIEDMIELLRANTVFDKVNAFDIDLPAGYARVPRLAGTAGASWGGENTAIVPSDPTLDEIELRSKRLVAGVVTSNELLNRSPIAMEQVIKTDITEAASRRIDQALFGGSGIGDPLGIANLPGRPAVADNPVDGNVAVDATALNGAVRYLRGMMATARRGNSRLLAPAWSFHPDALNYLAGLRDGVGGFPFAAGLDAEQPKLFGYPVYDSTQHATDLADVVTDGEEGTRIFFFDAADLVRAREQTMQVEISNQAGGAFLSYQTIVRLVQFVDIGYRHPESFIQGRVNGWN